MVTRASVVSVISADSKPAPMLSDDLLELGGVFGQTRNISDQHKICQTGCGVHQHLLAPT
jgi:hypothetical protein